MSNQFGKKMKGLVWFAVAFGIFLFIALILAALQLFKMHGNSN
jgi:hypothetical protein